MICRIERLLTLCCTSVVPGLSQEHLASAFVFTQQTVSEALNSASQLDLSLFVGHDISLMIRRRPFATFLSWLSVTGIMGPTFSGYTVI